MLVSVPGYPPSDIECPKSISYNTLVTFIEASRKLLEEREMWMSYPSPKSYGGSFVDAAIFNYLIENMG